jgi:hypothetical protein
MSPSGVERIGTEKGYRRANASSVVSQQSSVLAVQSHSPTGGACFSEKFLLDVGRKVV